MSELPVNLHIAGRLCVVVGGGAVGLRKVRVLHAAGARVRLVTAAPPAGQLAADIEVRIKTFAPADLEGAQLVFAATDRRAVNEQVARSARAAHLLVNVADAPYEGDFSLPAVTRRGDLTLAVSTAGRSPALAALVRDRVEELFGVEWATILQIATALRGKRLTLRQLSKYNQDILHDLVAADLPHLIATGDGAAVDRLLEQRCGVTLTELAIELPRHSS
jgi:precorrin-2 dehydrogenase/sirohydrochlorin ferrochelatase